MFGWRKNMNKDNLIFCTVNANSNEFTNITIKSILKFHPTAKIFIIDAFAKKGQCFQLINENLNKNVEVINGISSEDIDYPVIQLSKTNLTQNEQLIVQKQLQCGNEINIVDTGDLNHTMNIQYAIDTINCNFILIDNDAPLICPVDFFGCDKITVSQVNSYKVEPNRVLLSEEYSRFVPFIQYLNVNLMKKYEIYYYNKLMFTNNLKSAVRTSKDNFLLFPTGSWMFRQVFDSNISYSQICYKKYVDHFGGGSWCPEKELAKEKFIKKYIG